MFETIKSDPDLGGVDVCVNNAGLGHDDSLLEGKTSYWREMFDVRVNLFVLSFFIFDVRFFYVQYGINCLYYYEEIAEPLYGIEFLDISGLQIYMYFAIFICNRTNKNNNYDMQSVEVNVMIPRASKKMV